MTPKRTSLAEDTSKKLQAEKQETDSFSQTILQLLKQKKNKTPIEQLAGIFETESSEWEEIEKKLYKDRLKSIRIASPEL